MYPNTYLRTFWRGEIKPRIFVAMRLGGLHEKRFEEIIRPAIQEVEYGGVRLEAHRVDLSKSGDAVLTEVADAVTHSVMVLADVSTLGWDAATGNAYRDDSVMCAVGMALACRQPAEVLLLRDDNDDFLFDVSTVPRIKLNLAEARGAKARLAEQLRGSLREIDLVNDARVQAAVGSMTGEERQLVAQWGKRGDNLYWLAHESAAALSAFSRLLDKQLIRTAGMTHDGHAMFTWTRLGRAAADSIDRLLPITVFAPTEKPDQPAHPDDDGGPNWG